MVRRNELEEPGETVDHDDYTFPEIEGTPVQEGARCYTLDVSKTPPDKWGVPFSIIFTKVDKNKKGVDISANIKAFEAKIAENWEVMPPIFRSSAEKKIGRKEILDYIFSIIKEI